MNKKTQHAHHLAELKTKEPFTFDRVSRRHIAKGLVIKAGVIHVL